VATTETNYWKIGLFVAVGGLLSILALFWLAAQRLNRDLLPSVTYFDESVEGLDIGAPVKMRGVTIGNVSRITFAPDQRLVEVHSEIYADVMRRIGFPFTLDRWQAVAPPEDLRVQLSSSGITGIKFLSVDFFEPLTHPTIELSFAPPNRYVPSTRSTLKTIEEGAQDFLQRAPRLITEMRKLAATTERRVSEFDAAALSRKFGDLADELVAKLKPLDLVALEQEGTGLLRETRELVARAETGEGAVGSMISRWGAVGLRIDQLLEQSELEKTGSLANDLLGEFQTLARTGNVVLNGLRADMDELRAALKAMRALAEYLERDPGALIRGRDVSGN
jgi:paraquat-inducible protein B